MIPRILVTRPVEQCEELTSLLMARGMSPMSVPTVAIDTASTISGLDAMLATLEGADWLIVTSANGAGAITGRLEATGRPLPAGLRVAAVGPKTADALRAAGIGVDHVPSAYLTAAVADGLGEVRGRRIVLARANAGTDELPAALAASGAIVEEVVAYRTIEGPPDSRDPLRIALNRELDGIAFTSGSTVRGVMRLASSIDRARARALPAFCIGPVTAGVARRMGFHVAAIAGEHTAGGLVDAITAHFVRGPNDPAQ